MATSTWEVALSVLLGMYTQGELARLMGAAESTVGTWVRGEHRPHPKQRRKLIAEAYKRAPHDMRALLREERGADEDE